ncbi:MAG: biotin/lipoyl-binding protein [Oscillospiraceae bacterium]|nr:biotin/lipoyl-binding protein [Oscillospiraceae bacterium]
MKERFKVKTLKLFLCFLTLMLIMTFVSRMYYTGKLPRVTTVSFSTKGLKHTVESRGILDSVKKTPVFVQEGLRIAGIFVNDGDTVTKDDILMQLDEQYLSDKINTLEKELDNEIRNSPGSYEAQTKTPVFTQPGLRVAEVAVKQGDHVDNGQLLARLDIDFLNNCISDLVNDLNADYAARDGYYDQEDTRSADAISNTIEQKERTLQRYYNVSSCSGEIYSSRAGIVTDLFIQAGAVTDDSAVACISDDAQLVSSAAELQDKLNNLRAVAESGGKITSDYSGVISEVSLSAGDITTETAVFIVSDVSSGMLFCTTIKEEDTKYIAVGDTVSLSFRNGKVNMDECEVKVLLRNDTDGTYHVRIPIDNKQLSIGETGEMSSGVISEEQYDCVPVSAVTEENEKSGYLYVLEETEGFLGPEYTVRKVSVNIADKNDTYYGLSELGLDKETKIIISSTKDLNDGQTVRRAY